MTARRPPKITVDIPVNTTLHAVNEDGQVDEAAGTHEEAVNLQTLRSARDLPDQLAAPILHPALTDYGSASAANSFRQTTTNQQPAIQSIPAPVRAGRRPRNRKAWRLTSDNPSIGSPTLLRECAADYEGPELLEFSNGGSPPMSKALRSLLHGGNSGRRNNENVSGIDENKMRLRRKGLKRARRTSTSRAENLSAHHSDPHGATLLRSMRLRRAKFFDRNGNSEDLLPVCGAVDTEEDVSYSGTNSSVDVSDRPVSADWGELQTQRWLPAARGEIGLDGEDDLASLHYAPHHLQAEIPSSAGQARPVRLSRAQRRTSFSSRRLRLSSPPLSTLPAHRKLIQDKFLGTFHGRDDHEDVDSEGDSASSQEGLNLDPSLTDMQSNTLRLPERNPSRSGECHHWGEEAVLPFLDCLKVPTSTPEQRRAISQQPASMEPTIDPLAHKQTSFKYHQTYQVESLEKLGQRAHITVFQRSSAEKRGELEGVMRNNRSAPRHDTISVPSRLELDPSSTSLRKSTGLQPETIPCGWPDLPTEIYLEIARYLSREDAMNLRLVCRDFSIAMVGAVFGSVVVPFSRGMYDIDSMNWDREPPSGSMFEKYGLAIRKFGIAFEADENLIARAQTKTISNEQSSWWGNYNWPIPVYPRFNHLHVLENLADNVSLLKSAMAFLGKTHELGLSIDSGHGWLNGPDMSDMALFDARCGKGTSVFGKNLPTEDKHKQATRVQLFERAQRRTLQECIEILQIYNRVLTTNELAFLRSVAIRDLESFKSITQQPDFDAAAHVGGAIPTVNTAGNVARNQHAGQPPVAGPHQPPNGIVNAGMHNLGATNPLQQPLIGQHYNNPPAHPNPAAPNIAALHPAIFHNSTFLAPLTPAGFAVADPSPQPGDTYQGTTSDRSRSQAALTKTPKQRQTSQPQFPIIFNGYNLSAEIGGWCHLIQKKVASPKYFPLQPGTLTEAQAQWLMETVWAQRAFLSAYTTSILANKLCFAEVHSLHIAKISSGLLSSLEQRELWQGLPSLTNLIVLVSPDWRVEHITGDQSFRSNMLVSPVGASQQLSGFLKTYIAPLEKLSTLTIGFVGGGEHAIGIMARNQHVLPAPISSAPQTWLSDHITEPDPRTLITFNHIKQLTLQNTWLSPLMLEAFMIKSQDTSLRTLVLDSISLTASHGQRLVAPLTTAAESLDPVQPPSMWLYESLPTTHCWPATIDRITPGATFLDKKYDAGMIADPYTNPRPPPNFRGFVSRLVFKSCGYVRISGLSIQDFNQNDLVYPNSDPMDAGLKARAAELAEKGVMLSDKNPNTGADWPLLGTLTQCIHPVEKRVLEQAWGMTFGWDDDMERWAAVEDGFFEGGTGRFSGVIDGEGGKGIGEDGM